MPQMTGTQLSSVCPLRLCCVLILEGVEQYSFSNYCGFFHFYFSKQVNISQIRYPPPQIVILQSKNNGVLSSQKYSGNLISKDYLSYLVRIETLMYLNKI